MENETVTSITLSVIAVAFMVCGVLIALALASRLAWLRGVRRGKGMAPRRNGAL